MARPRFSTPTRGYNLPALISPARCRLASCASAWTAKAVYLDNIFIERLWRSLKYEDVYIKAYASVREARSGIGSWLAFYNDIRLHQALGYRTPREIFQAARAYG